MDASLYSKIHAGQAAAAHAVGTALVPKQGTSSNVRYAVGAKTARPAAAGSTGGTTGTGSSTTASTAGGATITSTDFLTLLVSELKNQDPTQPTDPKPVHHAADRGEQPGAVDLDQHGNFNARFRSDTGEVDEHGIEWRYGADRGVVGLGGYGTSGAHDGGDEPGLAVKWDSRMGYLDGIDGAEVEGRAAGWRQPTSQSERWGSKVDR